MGLVVPVGALLGTEGNVSDVIDSDVFFVLEVAGDFRHAHFNISDMVALQAGSSWTELFTTWAL